MKTIRELVPVLSSRDFCTYLVTQKKGRYLGESCMVISIYEFFSSTKSTEDIGRGSGYIKNYTFSNRACFTTKVVAPYRQGFDKNLMVRCWN